MVTVTFRLSGIPAVSLDLDSPTPLAEVVRLGAQTGGLRLGGYIAVRRGQVLAADAVISGEDEIEIFPALSGG